MKKGASAFAIIVMVLLATLDIKVNAFTQQQSLTNKKDKNMNQHGEQNSNSIFLIHC